MSAPRRVDRSSVKRRSIQVIKSRLEDIEVGDVVNRNPDAELGWFTVEAVSTLFNGHLQLADDTEQLTVSGGHKDMVGVQLVEEISLDDRGVIAAPEPVVAVAPPAPAPAPEPAPAPAPAPTTSALAPTPPEPAPVPTPPEPAPAGSVDLAAEVAAAAAVATKMPAPPSPGKAAPNVDLELVASLLEQLNVGEAPAINAVLGDAPMAPEPAPVIPANAVAVDGGVLPEKPSYKNPIVVPEGIMLPRRSRAA